MIRETAWVLQAFTHTFPAAGVYLQLAMDECIWGIVSTNRTKGQGRQFI